MPRQRQRQRQRNRKLWSSGVWSYSNSQTLKHQTYQAANALDIGLEPEKNVQISYVSDLALARSTWLVIKCESSIARLATD